LTPQQLTGDDSRRNNNPSNWNSMSHEKSRISEEDEDDEEDVKQSNGRPANRFKDNDDSSFRTNNSSLSYNKKSHDNINIGNNEKDSAEAKSSGQDPMTALATKK